MTGCGVGHPRGPGDLRSGLRSSRWRQCRRFARRQAECWHDGEVPAGLTDPDAKAGGYYELSIWLGDRDDAWLQTAIEALARAAGVTGPWREQPDGFVPASWTVADVADEGGGVWGEVELPDGRTLICFVLAIRYDNGEDWLDLSIPTGALEHSDRRVGGYPFGPDAGPQSLAWRLPIDAWFASLAAQVRQVTGFRQAVIGHEVSGEAVESAAHSPADRPGGIVLADGTYLPAGG